MLNIECNLKIYDLIVSIKAHRFFLRLGDMNQHGTLGSFFPKSIWSTLSYTRLEHSLGVAALSSHVGEKLQNLTSHLHYGDPRRVNSHHTLILELACLLHDIGHGPLSHQFDRFVKTLQLETSADATCYSNLALHLPDHEERGVRIIYFLLGECWDLRWSEAEFPGGLTRLCSQVKSLILGQKCETLPPCMWNVLHAASTHDVDIDRLEYLPRDAKMLQYGKQHEWSCVALHLIDTLRISTSCDELLFDKASSQKLLLLRQQLHDNIYVRTLKHDPILAVSMHRFALPEHWELLHLSSVEVVNAYMLHFSETRLLQLFEVDILQQQ